MKLTTLVIFFMFIVGIYGASITEIPMVEMSSTIFPAAVERKTTTKSTTALPTTTTIAPTSTSTTTTTPSTPSTTTSSPITTTTQASTTTQAPTTTTSKPNSTTTIEPPTTTPTPNPTPSEPEAANWTLTDGNQTCIMLRIATQLNVSYTTVDNKTVYFTYNLPKDGIVNGTCGNGTNDQIISITWKNNNVFNMTFKLKQHEYSLHKVVFSLSNDILLNANQTSVKYYHVGNDFETQANRSYRCTRVQMLNLTATETATDVVGSVSFSKSLIEAYHVGSNTQYSTPIDCDAISTPDIVPIAVGIALIALVVIVLIAYLVGRNRSRANGYVSM